MKFANETDVQFTERMREKYKDVLERIEFEGLNDAQSELDRLLSSFMRMKPMTNTAIQDELRNLKGGIDEQN